MVDDDRLPLGAGETPVMRKVRFRTLGCYPLTGAIESEAETLADIIQELRQARTSERQGRLIDHDAIASMEKKKQEGLLLMACPRRSPSPRRRRRPRREPRGSRFITCGSVDDGKSTLIGRLLFEAGIVLDDHLAALEADSKRLGTQDGGLDFALLLDGLTAEREQKITIDVAYRYFATDARTFIVADTPGHEQYTRNMVTGASTADAALLLVDARKGLLTQTRRHSHLVALLGIRHVALAVNKMDLVDYSADVFAAIQEAYRAFARQIGLGGRRLHPGLGARRGQRRRAERDRCAGTRGPTILRYLETVEPDDARMRAAPFRLPVQWVNRPHADFRGFAGTVAGGTIRLDDRVRVQPSGRESRVARIVAYGGDLDEAGAGQAITLVLADEIDVSRGDVISAAEAPAGVADQFEATIIWMSEQPMLPGRPYWLKIGPKLATATLARPKYRLNVNTLEHLAAKKLELNEIGVCDLVVDRPDRVRCLQGRPGHRRLHPHRPPLEQHGRRGPGALRAAARPEHPLAGRGRRQGRRARA